MDVRCFIRIRWLFLLVFSFASQHTPLERVCACCSIRGFRVSHQPLCEICELKLKSDDPSVWASWRFLHGSMYKSIDTQVWFIMLSYVHAMTWWMGLCWFCLWCSLILQTDYMLKTDWLFQCGFFMEVNSDIEGSSAFLE